VSLPVGSAQAAASLRSAIAVMFQLDPARIEIRASGDVVDTKPLLCIEVRVDGELAGEDVQEFVTGLLSAARKLAEMADDAEAARNGDR
jgi:hypothetical protein